MKRILLATILLIAAAGILSAETSFIFPRDARSMGEGGSFSSISSGYMSFFGNPAGFAGKGSFTIIDDASWLYLKPTAENIDKALRMVQGKANDAELRSTFNDLITSNGFGGGTSLGLGWAGRGFALGTFLTSDQYIYGETLLGSRLMSRTSLNAVLGIGITVFQSKNKNLSLAIGADVRPFFRVDSLGSGWEFYDILDPLIAGDDPMTVFRAQEITTGVGLAMDFGLMFKAGFFTLGASVRDLSPAFKTGTATLGDLIDGRLPSFTTSSTLNPKVAAGVGFDLSLLPSFIDTNIYAEMTDIIPVITNGASLLTRLHAGADLKLLSILVLRGGVNAGYVSVGAGLDLWFLELDAALFTEELGLIPGNKGRTGIALQAAIRF